MRWKLAGYYMRARIYYARRYKIRDKKVPLYADKIWSWFRCFVAIWFGMLLYYGLSIGYESILSGLATHSYAYGMSRFWFFYIPVFGYFLRRFYYEYTGDGVWTPGVSYSLYFRSWLRDFFS